MVARESSLNAHEKTLPLNLYTAVRKFGTQYGYPTISLTVAKGNWLLGGVVENVYVFGHLSSMSAVLRSLDPPLVHTYVGLLTVSPTH